MLFNNPSAVPETIAGLDFDLRCDVHGCDNPALYMVQLHDCETCFSCIPCLVAYQTDFVFKLIAQGEVPHEPCGQKFNDLNSFLKVYWI